MKAMLAESARAKRTMRRLLLLLIFLLIIAGILTYFIVADIFSRDSDKGVFVFNTINNLVKRCVSL